LLPELPWCCMSIYLSELLYELWIYDPVQEERASENVAAVSAVQPEDSVENWCFTLLHKWFIATISFFLGAAPSPAAPIMGVLESPWTSHPYKSNSRASWWYYPPLQMGRFVRAAHSPAAPAVWFVGAAQSPAAPTNPRCIKVHPLLLPPWVTHSNPRKKGWEALGTSQKLFY
jgi:hypothetical protein